MKKLLSLFLSLILIVWLCVLPAAVSAEAIPAFVLSKQEAAPGGNAQITVSLKDSPEIASVKLVLDYDGELTLNSLVYNEELGGIFQPPASLGGQVILNWVSLTPISGDLLFATLEFTVSDYSEFGCKSVSVSYNPDDVCNIDENNVYFDVVPGGVIVPCEHVNTHVVDALTPTCHTAGNGQYTVCDDCGEVIAGSSDELPIDPSNHTGGSELRGNTLSSCTENGYTGDTYCLGCGAVLVQGEVITAPGHAWGDWETVTEPNCTEKGEEKRVCGTDNTHTESRDIEPLGHNYGAVVTAPTCTEAGFTTYTCSRCKDSYTADETEPLGHTGGTATCASRAVCTRCEQEYGEVDANNHDGETEIRNASASTCTVHGYSGDTYCLGCGEKILSGEELPLAGHTLGDWLADETDHWHACTVCEGKFDLAAHTYEWVMTRAATEQEAGLREEICSVCGHKSGNSEEVPYSTHIPGDINGDKAVNNKDLTRLFQYLSDWDVEVTESALDVNGDGSVNNKDLTRLFQYLSDWEVQIH